ncbi:MAG: Asp-tRNA(Asn)/Glu-tRNA(Gln) amidotransferase subunit GatA [Candidatus Brocadiia bacterium]
MTDTPRTAVSIREAFLRGETSAADIVEQHLARIADIEPTVDAFLTVCEDQARERARQLDEKLASGAEMGLLAGVPVAVKDNICTRGVRTTCGSKILGDFVPPYDAHVVERLLAEDAVIIGKTNMDEFAMGSSTENSGFKVTRNPWDTGRIPGGSSGGSAAAVAAGMVPLALGSDTGGSIRQPAALCGVVGMKPTYGRVSRYGLVAFASSLDQIGPFARTAEDAALLLQAIAPPDGRDSTCTEREPEDYVEAAADAELTGLRIGVPREFFLEQGTDAEVSAAVAEARRVLEGLGARFTDVSLPHSRIDIEEGKLSSYAVACYYVLCTAEASSNLARYDGVKYGHRSADHEDMIDMYSKTRGEGFGDEVKRRIMLGTYALSSGYYDAYFLKAARVRRLIRRDFDRVFEDADLLFCPTTPTPAFRIGEKTADPLEMYLSDIFTISCNLAGVAGISVPCGFTGAGLPLGMQLMARHWDDSALLRATAAYQQETDHHERLPDPSARHLPNDRAD